jgi:DNA polymerase III subunit gamma/tau
VPRYVRSLTNTRGSGRQSSLNGINTVHQVIARTYRPQLFSEVIGQRHVTQTLQNALRLHRTGHGYIFSGMRGVGKTTMARLLAKALNCHRDSAEGGAPEPCGECPSCVEIAGGRSVDVIEIDAASNRGIDAVRELRENARYAPARDKHKIFIIDEAHQITNEGFNALLKTLEEPPAHVVFVLATTELHDLPETILSRCQHFAFHAGSFAEILGHLENICKAEGVEADGQALAAIAASAGGSLRDALSRLEQAIAAFGTKLKGDAVLRLLGAVPSQMVEEVFAAVSAQSRENLLGVIARLVDEGYQLPHFTSQLVRAVRNMLVAKVAGPVPHLLETSPEECQRLAELAEEFSEQNLMRFLDILLQLHQQLRHTSEARFVLELGLLKLVEAERLVPLEELIARLDGAVPVKPNPPNSPVPPPRGSPGANASERTALERPSAPRLTPFEQDTQRKMQAQNISSESATEASAAAPPKATEGTSESESDVAAPAQIATIDGWRDSVLRTLEESNKLMLLSILEEAQWELSGSDARISTASASVVSDADKKLVEQMLTKAVGQPVKLTFLPVTKTARELTANMVSKTHSAQGVAQGKQPSRPSTNSRGGVDAETEARVRQDPEIKEFEDVFGKSVTGIRRWRG